ncbi:Arginase deacetylase [Rhizoctonia solani]|uniref:Arginase deacetylase n=1 Tax=Rhizoctonia solani TaxID=456999 RepID=A0A8H7M726_9AGAM|nr:Arginase deacetylase [Rhizoctonia solani]
MSSEPRVAYVCSPDLIRVSSLLPSNRNRSALVHTLVSAYGLLKRANCILVKPGKASRRDLERYHEAGYLDYALQPHRDDETGKGNVTEFGLEDDCEVFPGLDEYIYTVAAPLSQRRKPSKVQCSTWLFAGTAGAHAAGFCYVADCVLSILQLKRPGPGQKTRPKVAYLDLDLHHGDGVAEAFSSQSLEENQSEDSMSQGAFFRWDTDVELEDAPKYLVVQCGVDGLAGDPYASDAMDRSPRGGLKIVFLGGGGYNSPNAARAWAYVTSIIVGRTGQPLSINDDIPDHSGFLKYAPSFVLDVPAGNMQDDNIEKDLEQIENNYNVLIERIQRAQSS